MRDSAHVAARAKTLHNEKLLALRLEDLYFRQRAAETLLTEAPLWRRLSWVLWPENFVALLDAAHMVMLSEANEERKRASQIKVVPA